MTITSVAVLTAKFLFGACDCTFDIDVGTSNFLLILGILQMWACAHVIAHVSGHGLYQHHIHPEEDLASFSSKHTNLSRFVQML